MNTYALVLADLDSGRPLTEQRMRSHGWRSLAQARPTRRRSARTSRPARRAA